MGYFITAAVLITLFLLVRNAARLQRDRDAKAAAMVFEHIACPIIVTSNHPADNTVAQRAFEWKQALLKAGNKYAEQIPVIEYPFQLARQELGIIATWEQYRAACLQKEQTAFQEWATKMQRQNEALHGQFILGQKMNMNTL